jgi:branched-chain amino acid transport system substrate-binding protein
VEDDEYMRFSNLSRLMAQGAGAAVLLASMSLAACGSTSNAGNGDIKNIIIGTDLPVSGADAGVALPCQNGIDLAISEAQLPKGYTVTFDNKNDEGTSGADQNIGKTNIEDLVQNSNVVGVVGPFNSGVAVAEIPVINAAGLTEISPSNTNPGLTKSQFAAANGINFALLHPAGKPEAYFRLPGTDDVQGQVDAQVATSSQVNAHKVFVVDDNSTYGLGLATYFSAAFTSMGGTVLGHAHITPQTLGNLPSLVTQILGSHPDAVFYGGVTSQGGAAMKKALGSAGAAKLPVIGGDGIADDPQWSVIATNAYAINTVGSEPAPPPPSLLNNSAVTTFISNYKAKYNADPTPYSLLGFDSAGVIIQAITNLINAGTPVTRANVRSQVAGITYQGLTGKISFDANGDNSGQKVFSIWAITDTSGMWKYVTEVNV